jgi:hypothetical protein
MAEDRFPSAPPGTGGVRNLSRQIAAIMVGKDAFGKKKGVNAQDKAKLSEQSHIQNVQRDVMKYVLKDSAANASSGPTTTRKQPKSRTPKSESIGRQFSPEQPPINLDDL